MTNKVLLATSALSLLVAGSAFAQPTVTIGGNVDARAAFTDQGSSFQNGAATRESKITTESALEFKVDGKTDNGLGYGGLIELNANPTAQDSGSQTEDAEKAYVYVESGLGRGELGANASTTETLKVDAGTFARATGGVAGASYDYISYDTAAISATTNLPIVTPELPGAALPGARIGGDSNADNTVDSNDRSTANANKITYYSPRMYGLQAGVSYTPDTGDIGNNGGATSENNRSFENVWDLALNYDGEFQGVGVKASAGGQFGEAEKNGTADTTNYDDLNAYELGLALSYAGATVGGSWADISEFGRAASTHADGNYWTAGGAYEFGPFAASVTYMESEVTDQDTSTQDNNFKNVVLGADYQLAPGFVPYVEVSFFELDDNTTGTVDNDGNVVLVGTQLNF